MSEPQNPTIPIHLTYLIYYDYYLFHFFFLSTYHLIYLIDIIIIMGIQLDLGIIKGVKPIYCWTAVKFVQSEYCAN